MDKESDPVMPHSFLQVSGICKAFAGNVVLDKVDFDVRLGEIHVLMGENGAGKSTLMNILAGVLPPDAGAFRLGEREFSGFHNPLQALHEGVSFIHQELCLSLGHSVWRNVLMGREVARFGWLNKKAIWRECEQLIGRVGARCRPETIVGELSAAERQLIEVARALRPHTKILILDEPTDALSETEAAKIMALIRQLKEAGLALIYISHRIREVCDIADRVSVLRDGRLVATLSREEVSEERVVSLMVGRELEGFYVHPPRDIDEKAQAALRVRGLEDGRRVFDVSFDMHQGELLVLSGLVGAGRTELARLLVGIDQRQQGDVRLHGKSANARSVSHAQAMGMVYVPEDRKGQGLFLEMSSANNVVFNRQRELSRAGFRSASREGNLVRQSTKDFSIRMRSPSQLARTLSGGNQQKLLLARSCAIHPKLLIFDEPTRGVDVGARQEIYRAIARLVEEGTLVLVISSDLMEVIGLRSRVLVMHQGRITADLPGFQRLLGEEEIMMYATGLRADYGCAAS